MRHVVGSSGFTTVLDATTRASASLPGLVFLEAAFRSARRSAFCRPAQVLEFLRALSEHAGTRLQPGSSGDVRTFFRARGFTLKTGISQTARTRYGADYHYRVGGRIVLFDHHVTLGAGSANTCISIHFAWDPNQKAYIVAHVGRHLRNTRS